jgi:AraC-like DNA-binding protein
MARSHVMSQAEIRRRVQRLRDDPERPISFRLFSELVGVSEGTLKNVFILHTYQMSEIVQIRVSRALQRLEAGDVVVMKNRWGERKIEYLNQPKPRLRRSMGLTIRDGQIGLKIGIRNRGDYSEPTFRELIEGDE